MAKKADKAEAKRRKIKIPKQVGGVKIPKDVRKEGERLIAAATALLKTQATAAVLGAMAKGRFDASRRRERRDWDDWDADLKR